MLLLITESLVSIIVITLMHTSTLNDMYPYLKFQWDE
jgi:hypothetical protein